MGDRNLRAESNSLERKTKRKAGMAKSIKNATKRFKDGKSGQAEEQETRSERLEKELQRVK